MSFRAHFDDEEVPPSSSFASMDVDDSDEFFPHDHSHPRPSQSRASQIYGVFADSDDDDEDEKGGKVGMGRKGRRKKGGGLIDDSDDDDAPSARGLGAAPSTRVAATRSGALLTRTMKFVSSSAPAQPLPPPLDERKDPQPSPAAELPTADSAPSDSVGFKRRRLAEKQRIERQKRPDDDDADDGNTAPSPLPAPVLPVRAFRPPAVDKDFAAFTKHSSGAAMRMLEKMGFRGRLGKHETGVSAPILPVVRPNRVGLGGIKEKGGRIARNANEEGRLEEEQRKSAEEKKAQQQAAAPLAVTRGWRKGQPKPKKTYRTAAEVRQSGVALPPPTVIIDMTAATPVQRHVGQLSSASPASVASTSPSAVPELAYNVQLLVDLTEAEIAQIDRRLRELQVEMDEVEKENDRTKAKAVREAADVERLNAVVQEVERMHRTMTGMQERPLDDRLDVLEAFVVRMRKEHSREWRMYLLVQVVVVMLYPIVRALLHDWEPLPSSPSAASTAQSAHVYAVLERWRALLDESTAAGYYHELVSSLVLPPLRLALSASALSLAQYEPIVDLLLHLRSVLPPSLFSSLCHSLLFPRLQAAVAQWNPRTSASLHHWLVPYSSVLSPSDMASLYVVVRQKMGYAAAAWKVEDDDVREGLAAWQDVWEAEEMAAFVNKLVLPKLVTAFSARPAVAPPAAAAASVATAASLLRWRTLLPETAFASLLRRLLSGFLYALHDALTVEAPDYDLLLGFYSTYSELLSALPTSALVTRALQLALDLLNAAMEDRPLPPLWRAALSWLDDASSSSTSSTTSPSSATQAAAARQHSAARVNAAEESVALSGSELLRAWGERHGFDVYPSGKRRAGVHEVYVFGTVSVYWAGADVYALNETSRAWEVVSLTTLLQRAQQAQLG